VLGEEAEWHRVPATRILRLGPPVAQFHPRAVEGDRGPESRPLRQADPFSIPQTQYHCDTGTETMGVGTVPVIRQVSASRGPNRSGRTLRFSGLRRLQWRDVGERSSPSGGVLIEGICTTTGWRSLWPGRASPRRRRAQSISFGRVGSASPHETCRRGEVEREALMLNACDAHLRPNSADRHADRATSRREARASRRVQSYR
jgi:hypothetical protein